MAVVMTEQTKPRQQQILKLLLENKAGLNIDELASLLAISRNAVQQHLTVLEKDGYIKIGELNKTAGRPVRSFVLTEQGINSFPKQYAWFSELILMDLKNQMGSADFQRYLAQLAERLSQNLLPQFNDKQIDKRVETLVKVMNSLGFNSSYSIENNLPMIEACNCIYHDLAQKHEEVCEFDRTLIASLLGCDIEHIECMAKGETICRFKLINK